MQKFGKSFGADGEFKGFSGTSAVAEQDLNKIALETAAGWKADQIEGEHMTILNGQYFNVKTQKYVDPDEVKNNVKASLQNNPKLWADLKQAGEIRGLQGKDLAEFIEAQFDTAATVAANKEGFMQESSKDIKNWKYALNYKDGLDRRRELDMREPIYGEIGVFNTHSNFKPSSLTTTTGREAEIAKIHKGMTPDMMSKEYARAKAAKKNNAIDRNIPLEDYLKKNPAELEANPVHQVILDIGSREEFDLSNFGGDMKKRNAALEKVANDFGKSKSSRAEYFKGFEPKNEQHIAIMNNIK